MAFVRALLLAYDRYGVDPRRALRQAGITMAQVQRPDARIDAGQMETLASAAMQELDDEALGWFSRRLPWGSYGMLCRASLHAADLRMALRRWCRHHGLLTDSVRLVFTPGRPGARLTIEEHADLGAMREFCLFSSLRYIHGYASWLVDTWLPLDEVTFPFGAPPHASVYALLFPGEVRFGARVASLSIDARYLDLVPRRDERALDLMLRRALRLTVKPYRRDRMLVERVRQLLTSDVRTLTAHTLASALHVSVRSLHRQLAQEGASLQSLKDDVRRQRAQDLLQRTSLPIKQIAARAGFDSDKSFARAFREWTGETPSEHRRRLGQGS